MATDNSTKIFDDTDYRYRSARRYKWGWRVSACWVSLGIFIALFADEPIWCLGLNELGDYLAGVFAPLAFLWLVIGYFQQGEELRLSRDEITRQANELEKSVRHQSILADTATLTHQVDMEDRKRRNRLDELSAQPMFRDFAFVGKHRAGSGHNTTEDAYEFRAMNVGEACWDVSIGGLSNRMFEIIEPQKDNPTSKIDSGESFFFVILFTDVSDEASVELEVRFDYTDQLMVQSSAMYNLRIAGDNIVKLLDRVYLGPVNRDES